MADVYIVHFSGETGTGASADCHPRGERLGERSAYVLTQVDISATATVQIQGRLKTNMSWANLLEDDLTTTSMVQVISCPYMRLNITANTGEVTAVSMI